MQHPLSGPGYLLQGMRLLTHPQIRWFVLGPLLINLLVFAGLTFLIIDQFSELLDWTLGYLPAWLDFLEWFIWVLFSAMLLIVYGYSFSIVGNLLASPLYGLLAERASEVIVGKKNIEPMSFTLVASIASKTFKRELKKLVYFLPRIVAVLLLTLILSFTPPLNLLSPIIIFLWGAWSLALQYMDYPADNDDVDFPTLKKLAHSRRLASYSFGGITLLATTTPLLNMIAIPAAVIGATVMWERELQAVLQQEESKSLPNNPAG